MGDSLQKASSGASPNVAASETALQRLEQGLSARTVDAAIKAPTLAMAIKELGEQDTYVVLTAAVAKCVLYFTPEVQPDPDQVTLFADYLFDNHKLEGLADVGVFFRKAALGDFGEQDEHGRVKNKGKTFGRLDAKKLKDWWIQYLDYKVSKMEEQAKRYGNEQFQTLFGNEVLAGMMKDGVAHAQATRAENDKAARLDRLRRHAPNMSRTELQEAWKFHPYADERAILVEVARQKGWLKNQQNDGA